MTKAVQVKNISKKFKIPHRRITSLKEGFLNIFNKNSFETFDVLKNLSFDIEKGESFGIIGQNGSGKSTLLKLIANIFKPSEGEILVEGLIAPFLELGVGFNAELTGKENIYLNGLLLGLTKKEISEKYNKIVEFSELERFIDEKLKNYSSGMQMRLAFSIAVQANMDILLLDEVLAVGDFNFQKKCLQKMQEFKKSGKTILFVTHDLNSIKNFCDRVLYLKNSTETFIGKPDKIIEKYIRLA